MSAQVQSNINAAADKLTHEHAYQRAYNYPVVKDTLTQANSIIHSNTYSGALFDRATQLSAQILNALEPLQKRFVPVDTIDSYANSTLDFVERKFPQVKSETGDLIKQARKPADDAAGLAKSYAGGIQSRLAPVTNEFSARIAQGQDTLHALHERLNSTIASSVPRDKASAQETLNSVLKEVESLSAYITKNAKEIPSAAQARAQPLIDGISEATSHIRAEITKSDTPIKTKVANILEYSQQQIQPLLNNIKSIVLQKTEQVQSAVEEQATPVVDEVQKTSEDVQAKASKTTKKAKAQVDRA
ncbi:hypothetical protein OIO90_003002 [Microbotryomycetes sp. JL221]|nr:hypothetical protein OIO90_003002 [Microbotryomycetes sp. JL221]